MTIKKYVGKNTINFPELSEISIETFFKEFGEMTPEKMLNFIDDPENCFELGSFVYHQTSDNKFPGYNGRGFFVYSDGAGFPAMGRRTYSSAAFI